MDLKLPPLGEGADSGTVVNIFVKEGDQVVKDQSILELENEKAVATVPSTVTGTITKIYVKTGDKISVGARILSTSDGAAGGAAPGESHKGAQPHLRVVKDEEAAEEVPQVHRLEPAEGVEPQGNLIPAASPSIRKLARELSLDLTKVRGSARGGRIVMEDIRAYIQRLQRIAFQKGTATAGAEAAPVAKPAEQIDFSKWGEVEKQSLSPLRQVIARRMSENWNAVPRVTQFDDVDITQLNALRKQYAPAYEKQGGRLTLTCFVLKAVVQALKKHPVFNSSLDETAQQIVLKKYFHIGVAVDTEAGLIVPVIRDVDKKSLLQISKELEALAAKARDRKVSGEELKGGTFTISNQGGIGGAHFTPIVNKPEVAILGLGRGSMKAVVRDNTIVPRLMMPIALSYDHRVIDGGTAARFTVDLLQAFEQFKEEEVKL